MKLKYTFQLLFLALCVLYSNKIFAQHTFEKSFYTSFEHGQANMVSYIQFPPGAAFGGYLEIEITGSFAHQFNRGLLKKRIEILFNGTSDSYLSQRGEIVAASEPLADQWAIGDFDPINFRIPIYHLVSSGNPISIVVKGHLLEASWVVALKDGLSLSAPVAVSQIPSRSYKNMAESRIGIGTDSPEHRLDVVGTVRAHEIMVNTSKTADHVFEADYDLRTLQDLEQFVKTKKHLPEIAPAKDMEKDGLAVSSFQIDLLKKIEELTLYVIDLQKQITELKAQKEDKTSKNEI